MQRSRDIYDNFMSYRTLLTLEITSIASLPCSCLLCPVVTEVIVPVGAAVNHFDLTVATDNYSRFIRVVRLDSTLKV